MQRQESGSWRRRASVCSADGTREGCCRCWGWVASRQRALREARVGYSYKDLGLGASPGGNDSPAF